MRKNITLAAVLTAGILLTGGCASTAKSDLSKLRGTWVGEEISGEKGECRITIEGDSIKFQGVRSQEWYVGKLSLDPNAKPKQAMVLIGECGFPKYVNKTAKAIYKLEGKSLTMAGNEPGNEAVPTAFERDRTSQTRAFVFNRQ